MGRLFRAGGAVGDFVGGLYLALGVAVALLERERTGTARVLDLSNQDCVFAIADSAATIFAGIGAKMERVGNAHPFSALGSRSKGHCWRRSISSRRSSTCCCS